MIEYKDLHQPFRHPDADKAKLDREDTGTNGKLSSIEKFKGFRTTIRAIATRSNWEGFRITML